MRDRRLLAMIGIAGIAILLAFPLREAVYGMIIVPAAYVYWVLSLLYRSVHQAIWWSLSLLIVLIILTRSVWPQFKVLKRTSLKSKPVAGQVESLAIWMKKTNQGVYFKWLIANRLGKIANQILVNRSVGRQRSFFDPLIGPDWTPDAHIQAYLESGLHGSFADYPQKNKFFSTPSRTPLDHELKDVIQYLESQVENK